MVLAAALWVGLLAASAPPGDDRVQVSIEHSEQAYSIHGKDFSALIAQIRRAGPTRSESRERSAAITRVEFVWEFSPRIARGRCEVDSVWVSARIVRVLPVWANRQTSDPEMQAAWDRFADALRSHERLHEDVGVATAHEIGRALRALPSSPDCADLRRVASLQVRQLLQRFKARNAEIDAVTGHGIQAGAVLVVPKRAR